MTALLLALWGCGDTHEGTIVGNPGQTKPALAPGADLAYTAASAERLAGEFTGCEEGNVEAISAEGADLLGGSALDIPAGNWCALRLTLEGVVIEGNGPEESSFYLELEPGEIVLAGDLALGEQQATVVELGSPGWVSADALGLPEAGEAAVSPDDALGLDLAAAIQEGSGMYLDADGDGQVDEGEREDPLLAAVTYEDQGIALDDGCAAGPRAAGWLGWLLALAIVRRRGRG